MSDAPEGLPYLGRYLAVLVAVVVALTVAGWLLARFAGFFLPPGAAAIIPPMAGALHVGQVWGRERGEVPEGRTAWRWAGVAGLVYLALILVLLVPVAGAASQVLGLAAMLVTGAVLMAVLVNRFFLTIGARSGVARHEGGQE
jgi:hypothetical protein